MLRRAIIAVLAAAFVAAPAQAARYPLIHGGIGAYYSRNYGGFADVWKGVIGETVDAGVEGWMIHPRFARYSVAGQLQWLRQFGSSGSDDANGLSADANGVYVGGFVATVLPGQVSSGGNDAYVRRYDAGGSVVWTSQFGTAGADAVMGLAIGSPGLVGSRNVRAARFSDGASRRTFTPGIAPTSPAAMPRRAIYFPSLSATRSYFQCWVTRACVS